MTRKEKIQKRVQKIDELRDKLNKELDQIELEENKGIGESLIGKCYKFENFFRGNRKDSWYLYTKVIAVNVFGYLECIRFQIYNNGMIEINPNLNNCYPKNCFDKDYELISDEEFTKAWAKCLDAIEKINKDLKT